MPQRRQSKAFGVIPAESKIAASATPLPPIVDSHATAEAEGVSKSPTVPATLDAKTVLPPISSNYSSEKIVEVVKSSSSLAEPLPSITGPSEVKDGEVADATSDATDTTELTLKENIAPLPPITPKQVPAMQFGDVYFVLG